AVKPINDQITSSLNHLFLKMQQQLTSKTDEQYHDAIESSLATVNAALAQGIRNSVMQSFEKNVTVKFTGIIERGVTAKVKQFIRREVAAAGSELIKNGAGASINLGGFLQSAGSLLAGIAD